MVRQDTAVEPMHSVAITVRSHITAIDQGCQQAHQMYWKYLISLAFSSVTFAASSQIASAQQYFYGDPCTQDCSGHQAGYDWAEQNGIGDASDCGGNSQSFIEGCESYAEENQPSADEDNEDEEDRDGEESDGY
jgi:hypothetical protein